MRLIGLSVPALMLLAACAAPGESRSHLAESTWKFTTIDDTAPASAEAQISFQAGHIGANVGCNGMGGPWRIENGRLIAGPLVQTEMYCEGPVWQQEQAVSALLAAAPLFEVNDDTMVLKSSGHFAELKRVE